MSIMTDSNKNPYKLTTLAKYVILLVFNLRGLRVYMYMPTQMWRYFLTDVIKKKVYFFPLKQVGERKFKINYKKI